MIVNVEWKHTVWLKLAQRWPGEPGVYMEMGADGSVITEQWHNAGLMERSEINPCANLLLCKSERIKYITF